MSIFNGTKPTVKQQKFIKLKPVSGDKVPLIAGRYTPQLTTENYDFLQLLHHGGGIYTGITYALDNKAGIKPNHGHILTSLMEFAEAIGSKKVFQVTNNIFTGELQCSNLRIKTFATFVIQNDKEIRDQLPEKGSWALVEIDGKPVQLFDIQVSDKPNEFCMYMHDEYQMAEFHLPPNDDFIATLLAQLPEEVRKDKTRMVTQMVNKYLPNLNHHAFITFVEPTLKG